jgi:hypothetical protein
MRTWDDTTSTTEGHLVFQSKDPSDASYFVVAITGITEAAGYFKIDVTPTGRSADPPFSNGENIVYQYTRSGDLGTQGAQGATGSGAQGATGAAGSTGAQGATGSGGSTGAQGAAGAKGDVGAQGATGSGGSTGAQGATGSGGSAGAQGATGATGAQGATGGGGGGTLTHGGASGTGLMGLVPVTWGGVTPVEFFDMAGAGMSPDGWLSANVGGIDYYWPVWVQH